MARRPQVHEDAGVSLIELLVVIMLMGIIGSVVTTSIVRSLSVSVAATSRVDALTSLQQAQERMSRVIREGVPVATPAPSATTLAVRIDTSASTYRILTYAYASDAVRLTEATYTVGVPTPTSTSTRLMIDQMDQGTVPVFRYVTRDGTTWVPGMPVQSIRRITITLQHRTDGNVIPLTTSVFPRNAVMEPLP